MLAMEVGLERVEFEAVDESSLALTRFGFVSLSPEDGFGLLALPVKVLMS